jgi:hypothetical protein
MAYQLYKYNYYNDVTKTITAGEAESPAYMYAETAPANYANIHNIDNLDLYGFNIDSSFDYKRVRDLIKLEVETIGFNNLTSGQQITAARHKIGTDAERVAAVNNDFDLLVQFGEEYHKKVLEVRAARMTAVKSNIHNRLGHILYGGFTGPEIILSEITEDLILMYENEGLGGVVDGDNAPGAMDYINETTGTPYASGAGLRSKPWTPHGFADCSVFSDYLLDILQKGIY